MGFEDSKQNIKPTGFVNPFVEKFFIKKNVDGSTAESQLAFQDKEIYPDGTVIAGPILHFRGTVDRNYYVAIIVLTTGTTPPRLVPNDILRNHYPIPLLSKKTPSGVDTILWRFDVVVRQRNTEYIQRYRIKSPYFHLNKDEGGGEIQSSSIEESLEESEEEIGSTEYGENGDILSDTNRNDEHQYKFIVPGIGTPLNIGANSCNKQHKKKPFVELWEKLHKNHLRKGLHLLIHLGDQVYTDPDIWKVHPKLKRFLSRFRKSKIQFTKEMEDKVDDYFFELYVRYWTIPEIAKVLAEIPNIMMWDDHDIFDGYGSYRSSWQETSVFQGIYNIAQKYFCLFQLGCSYPHEFILSSLRGTPGLSQVYHINNVLILSLDNRSERNRKLIMSKDTYKALHDYLYSTTNSSIDHVLVLIGIPIVYNSFNKIERILSGLNFSFEDDIKDHWRSLRHKRERKYIVNMLQTFAAFKKCRITVLSGDVHVGCAGTIESMKSATGNAAVINSIVTSGISSEPPPRLIRFYLRRTRHLKDHISRRLSIKGGLHEFDNDKTFLNEKRNFVLLLFDENNGINVEWVTEGNDPYPYKLYIHPYSESRKLDFTYGRTRGLFFRRKKRIVNNETDNLNPVKVT